MRTSLLVVTAFLLAGCGNIVAKCSQVSCMGCCDTVNDRCLSGTDIGWCGANGKACTACNSATEVCTRNACVSRSRVCSVGTCDGCCDSNGQCVDGRIASACGANGAQCGVCLATQNCVPNSVAAAGGVCQ
ncbi:MAG: hypothetical protein U0228_27655 [Myxococcaceae bacterium]